MQCIFTLQPIFLICKAFQLQAELLFASSFLFLRLGHILPCWTYFKSYYLCLATQVYVTFFLVLILSFVVYEDGKTHLNGPWLTFSLSGSLFLVPFDSDPCYMYFFLLTTPFVDEQKGICLLQFWRRIVDFPVNSDFLAFFLFYSSVNFLQRCYNICAQSPFLYTNGDLCRKREGESYPSSSHQHHFYILGQNMEIQFRYSPYGLVWLLYINSMLHFPLS